MMNRIHSTVSFGLVLGVLATASVVAAETSTVTTKSTTYVGTVSEVNPATSTIVLRSESSPAPVTYTYTKETTFVDATGKVVSQETIRNSPVSVEYVTEGGVTVARRVVQTGPSVVVTPPAAGSVHEKTTTRTETTH